ncbi:MAG: hypothetical protein HQL69_11985 [Magnetococcales bacterium]|nr:hypothetical protein [Magnetococcales bacterium]
MKINLLTVCTDKYQMIYAEKLISQFCKLSKLDVTPYCLTDRPEQLADFITPIKPKVRLTGWWNKVLLFDPEMVDGWNLYLDIDIVILKSFDDEIIEAVESGAQITCVSDAVEWLGNKFSSSLMIFKTAALADIYHRFMATYKDLQNREGGDQVWIGPQLKDVQYIDEKYPDLKKNFKFQFTNVDNSEPLAGFELTDNDIWFVPPGGNKPPIWICKKFSDIFQVPAHPAEGIKMIDFGGLPKPHQLDMIPYIKKNWHMV